MCKYTELTLLNRAYWAWASFWGSMWGYGAM